MSQQAIDSYWEGRLASVKQALEENNFAVWTARDLEQAKSIFWKEIFPEIKPQSVSFGGSMSIVDSGLYSELKQRNDLTVIDTYETSIPMEEVIERRRQGLLTDLYLTSSNALTVDGQLVNLDGLGNRVASLTFGPKHVVLLVGKNKITATLEQAFTRVKDYAAPVNAVRLGRKTPCAKTMECEDCKSPERICNTWTITEKSNPPKRVKIILINQDVGY